MSSYTKRGRATCILHAAVVVGAVLMACACVPASEKRPPAGAAGFVVEPSPVAAKQATFSSDGWDIGIDKLIVRVQVSAFPRLSEEALRTNQSYEGAAETYLFDASKMAQIFSTGISAGPAHVDAHLNGQFIDYQDRGEDGRQDNGDDRGLTILGDVSIDDVKRFAEGADIGVSVGSSDGSQYAYGPSVLLVIHARHRASNRTVTVGPIAFGIVQGASFGFVADEPRAGGGGDEGPSAPQEPPKSGTKGGGSGSDEDVPLIDVRANELTLSKLLVLPEAIFDDTAFGFGPIADADVDHDGVVSVVDLRAAPEPPYRSAFECIPPSCTPPTPSNGRSLLEVLSDRIGPHLLKEKF